MYERLATEVNANLLRINTTDTKVLNTSGFVSKTKYDSEKQNLEKKIEDIDKKVPNINWRRLNNKISNKNNEKRTDYTKIIEIENKIPSITGLVSTVALKTWFS